jgi:hypothetical protein
MVVLEAVPLEAELLDHLKNDLRTYRRWMGHAACCFIMMSAREGQSIVNQIIHKHDLYTYREWVGESST